MDENSKLIEKPSNYAIIPAIVRYDKELSPNAKLLYGEITSLLNFKNKCFASNYYFSRLYEVSEIQISRLVSQLVKRGYIRTEMETTATGSRRLIILPLNIFDNSTINKNSVTGLNKNDNHNNQRVNSKSLSNDKEIDLLFNDNSLDDYLKQFNNIKKSKSPFKTNPKIKKQFISIIKSGYSVKDLISAFQNALKDQFHIDSKFNNLTPEFFTRQDKLERYLNYEQISKKSDQPIAQILSF